MIYLELKGGLGNQLFQFAFAYDLSVRMNLELVLDTSSYRRFLLDTRRDFELDLFNINCFSKSKLPDLFERIINNFSTIKLTDENFDFNKLDYYKTFKYIKLNGYWQSEEFFSNSSRSIKSMFTLKHESEAYRAIKKRILSNNSTSIHIRRGDYLSNSRAAKVHHVCELEYYLKAADYINKNKQYKMKFYIFTDDINWAFENFKNKNFEIVSNAQLIAAEELMLMSFCQNNIISASSFSWWGAWLNDNEEKIVICPEKWFKSKEYPLDLIPKNWSKINMMNL